MTRKSSANNKALAALFLAGVALYLWTRRGQEQAAIAGEWVAESALTAEDYALSAGDYIMTAIGAATRGERNNNPGNLVKGENWQGMAAEQPDPRFITFQTPEYGIRALAKLLQNYGSKGYNTIAKIVTRYAPSSENDTMSYINSVALQMNVNPAAVLDLNDITTLASLTNAIISHENGRNIYLASGQMDGGIAMLA
jgi:hypothetical protein